MSDTGQPGGAERFVPAPGRDMSEADVMAGIEGLLDDRAPKRPPQPRNQPQRASDVPAETEEPGPDPRPGPEDPAPSEEEEDDYTPDADNAADQGDDGPSEVEPHRALTAQEKDLFRQLPPEAQSLVQNYIARRESDNEKVFTQKTQEIAEHRKALESVIQENQSSGETYTRNLEQLLAVAAPEIEKFRNIDWQRLAQEQPADYVRLTAERDALRNRIGSIQGEIQRVSAQVEQAKAYQFAQIRHAEQQKLIEAIPDFGDPEKAPKKVAEMRAFLNRRGFSDQEIGAVVDSRVIVLVDEMMQADRTREVRRQAETKRNGAAPQVQPPGAPRQRGDTQAAQRRGQKMAALRKSGSERDAISYLLEVL